jgi:hypothetical protein
MTDRRDWEQPPHYPPQGYGQQNPQGQPWPPQQYNPNVHHQRLGPRQPPYPPEGQERVQPGYGHQPHPGQPQYPPQGEPWPQPGYQAPQGPPPGWQPGYGQQPPWGPPPGYQPPQPPPRKPWIARHKALSGLIAFGCLIVLIIVANSGGSSSSSGAANTATQAAAPSSAAATTAPPSASPSPAARTVATYSGSGIENTPQFSVTATWKLDYSFDCSDFGSSGNFIVMEDGSFGAMNVNGLAMSKSGSSYAYDDAGRHYLEINSECSWSVKIIDEGL